MANRDRIGARVSGPRRRALDSARLAAPVPGLHSLLAKSWTGALPPPVVHSVAWPWRSVDVTRST